MTVAKLIKELQQFPPETIVGTSCCNGYDVSSLNGKVDVAEGAQLMQLHQLASYPKMFMVDYRDDPTEKLVDDNGTGVSQTSTPIIVIE